MDVTADNLADKSSPQNLDRQGAQSLEVASVGGESELQAHLELVAQAIGGTVVGSQVREFLELSQRHQLLFHGIKRAAHIPSVKRDGILPLTPESGPGSFWAAGSSLFFSTKPVTDSSMWMFDTPFFHYGISSGASGTMALAVTDTGRLSSGGIAQDVVSDSHCIVEEVVDPSLLTLVVVESPDIQNTKPTMFDFLLSGLGSGNLLESGVHELQV